jgi:hypothetical protein
MLYLFIKYFIIPTLIYWSVLLFLMSKAIKYYRLMQGNRYKVYDYSLK